MRAVQSVKIFNRETERSAVWMNRYAEVVRADASISLLKQAFQIANGLILDWRTSSLSISARRQR
jgi:ATP-binding cassette, subfamily B, bacterial CvaB/MchF/RaxB